MKWIKRCVGIAVLITGMLLLLYPDMNDAYISFNSNRTIREFEEQNEVPEENGTMAKVMEYNRSIFDEKQEKLSRENQIRNPLKECFKDDVYGTITIKRMNIKIPLYIGTGDEHLTGGAAVMGQTSLPVDQMNTNSVICAHRGWYGHPFFRDIELLKKGDVVQIDTLFGSFKYRVKDMKVISPFDEESIKIQENRKMITLSTCHPYGYSSLSNRYIVYCDLIEENEKEIEQPEEIQEEVVSVPGKSQNRILFETWGRRLLIVLVIMLIIFSIC